MMQARRGGGAPAGHSSALMEALMEWPQELLGLECCVVPRRLRCLACEGGRPRGARPPVGGWGADGAAVHGERCGESRGACACGRALCWAACAMFAAEEALSARRTFACRSGACISLVSWPAAAPPLIAPQSRVWRRPRRRRAHRSWAGAVRGARVQSAGCRVRDSAWRRTRRRRARATWARRRRSCAAAVLGAGCRV
jgi:hypothetical protein